jgi:hypothetical protein
MSIYTASAAAIPCRIPGMTARFVLAGVMDAPISHMSLCAKMSADSQA